MKRHDYLIVALIATAMKRTALLRTRAMPSVLSQTCLPDHIIIVDDNQDPGEFEQIGEYIRQLAIPKKTLSPSITLIRNQGKRGHSGTGAWNTGAHKAREFREQSGKQVYIAILDDDDRWKMSYLEHCVELLRDYDEHQPILGIVAGLERIEGNRVTNQIIEQGQLTSESFYIGNPGWQGSNTFVSLEAFFQAGKYDESLPSTNDRDFALRMLDLAEVSDGRLVTLPLPLIEHFAHSGPRVTTNIASKHRGLDLFYRKYADRMSPATLSASLDRAKRLFQYSPPSDYR